MKVFKKWLPWIIPAGLFQALFWIYKLFPLEIAHFIPVYTAASVVLLMLWGYKIFPSVILHIILTTLIIPQVNIVLLIENMIIAGFLLTGWFLYRIVLKKKGAFINLKELFIVLSVLWITFGILQPVVMILFFGTEFSIDTVLKEIYIYLTALYSITFIITFIYRNAITSRPRGEFPFFLKETAFVLGSFILLVLSALIGLEKLSMYSLGLVILLSAVILSFNGYILCTSLFLLIMTFLKITGFILPEDMILIFLTGLVLSRVRCDFRNQRNQNKRRKYSLSTIQKRLATAQKMAKLGSWEWNIENDTLFWTNELYTILGYDSHKDQASFDKLLSAVHPEDRESVRCAVNSCLSYKIPYSLSHRVKNSSGQIRYIQQQGDYITDENGNISFLVGTAQDVTAEKKNEEELIQYRLNLEKLVNDRTKALEKAKRRAEINAQVKSTFLANMSHEIRTPMNSVLGFLDIVLEQENLSPESRNYLKTAQTSAKGLLSLINDILDISKLDAGKLELERRKFSLHKLLKETIEILELTIKRKRKVSLELKLGPDIPQCIITDSDRLRQIIINLIGNAIKFTSKGKISLIVNLVSNGRISFTVKDTGIGMNSEQLKTLFSPFRQGDQSTARKYGGTGLGTSISKQLVQLMGGEIFVESREGSGSTFTFYLPLYIPDCLDICNPDCVEKSDIMQTITADSTRKLKILLAEDIEENATLVTIRLGELGHFIRLAQDGKEALQIFKEEIFDIVLMDIHMPVMDGMEATEKIRAWEKVQKSRDSTPIIALTASLMSDERERYNDAGFSGIVGKPIQFEELYSVMADLLSDENSFMDVHKDSQENNSESSFRDFPGIEYKKGVEKWKDEEAYIKALTSFRNSYNTVPEQLKISLKRNDFNETYQIIHKIYGLAGNLNLDDLYKDLKILERETQLEDKENILSYLPVLKDHFDTVLSSIGKLSSSEMDGEIKVQPLDKNTIYALLQELISHCKRGESVPDKFNRLHKKLAGYIDSQDLLYLSEAYDNYDFRESTDILFKISHIINDIEETEGGKES